MDQKMSLFALQTHAAQLGLLLVEVCFSFAGYFVVLQPQMWEDVRDGVRSPGRTVLVLPAPDSLIVSGSREIQLHSNTASPLWSGGKWRQLHQAFRSFPPRRPPADPRLLHSPFHVWKAITSLSFFCVKPPPPEKVNHLFVWCFFIVLFFI